MAERDANKITPICAYYVDGNCRFEGIDRPSLVEPNLHTDLSSLSKGKKLVDSALLEKFCGGRLRFGNFRGLYQKKNCDRYTPLNTNQSQPEVFIVNFPLDKSFKKV